MVFPRLIARPAWLPLLVLVMLSGCKTGQKLSLCSFNKPAKSSCATTCTAKPKVTKPVSYAPVEKWGSCGSTSKTNCTTKPVCSTKVSCATTACVPAKTTCTPKTSCAATCVPAQRYVRPHVHPQIHPKMHSDVQPKIVPKVTPRRTEPTPVVIPAKPVKEPAPAIAVPKKDDVTPNYDGPAVPSFPMNPPTPPVPPEPTTMRQRVPARTASNTSPFRQVIMPGRQSVAVIPTQPPTIDVPAPTLEPVGIEESNPFEELSSAAASQTQPVSTPNNNLSTAWADAIGLEDKSQIRETPILTESLPEFRRGGNQPQIAKPNDGWREAPARVVENIEEIPERN